jgi:hypothetical protein
MIHLQSHYFFRNLQSRQRQTSKSIKRTCQLIVLNIAAKFKNYQKTLIKMSRSLQSFSFAQYICYLVNFERSQHSTHSVERLDNELKELGISPLRLLKETSLHACTSNSKHPRVISIEKVCKGIILCWKLKKIKE